MINTEGSELVSEIPPLFTYKQLRKRSKKTSENDGSDGNDGESSSEGEDEGAGGESSRKKTRIE